MLAQKYLIFYVWVDPASLKPVHFLTLRNEISNTIITSSLMEEDERKKQQIIKLE
jgi:hypothetical protein